MLTFKDFIQDDIDENMKKYVIDLFTNEKYVTDSEIQTLSLEHGYLQKDVNQMIYRLLNSYFYYGAYQEKIKSFIDVEIDENELENGIAEELEHTNDRDVAKKIALDHLTATPDYYKILKNSIETE